jgi:hypothetical protein
MCEWNLQIYSCAWRMETKPVEWSGVESELHRVGWESGATTNSESRRRDKEKALRHLDIRAPHQSLAAALGLPFLLPTSHLHLSCLAGHVNSSSHEDVMGVRGEQVASDSSRTFCCWSELCHNSCGACQSAVRQRVQALTCHDEPCSCSTSECCNHASECECYSCSDPAVCSFLGISLSSPVVHTLSTAAGCRGSHAGKCKLTSAEHC